MRLPLSILTAIMFTALSLPATASAQCRKTYRYLDDDGVVPPAPPAVPLGDKTDDEESYVPPPPPPKPDEDDPRDTPPPVEEDCKKTESPRYEKYGDSFKDEFLNLSYDLAINDTGLRQIQRAGEVAEELDEVADALDGLGDASEAAGDAMGALGVEPSLPAAGFGNALDTARAVLQTTAELAAAAARFAKAVNERNSMYLIEGSLHTYHVELQWVERWVCEDVKWVCDGYELWRITFKRSSSNALDEDRETFPNTRSGQQTMARRFRRRQEDWNKLVTDDRAKLKAYVDKDKPGPCA